MWALVITILVVVIVGLYSYRAWNRLRTTMGGSREQRAGSARRRVTGGP
jgi:hypothetical protein